MKIENLEKPEIITISNKNYLGILNQDKNVIENGMVMGDGPIREDLKSYIKTANTGRLDDLKISEHQNFITRNLDENESIFWDELIIKMGYVKKTAISRLENKYFSE